jgi:hypothetical protein
MSKPYWNRRQAGGLKPGWKMTDEQHNKYWRMFSDICEATRFAGDEDDKKEFRLDWHEQSGLGRCSAKEITKLEGYDAIKSTWLAITQPDNLTAQMAMLQMHRTRLIYKIRQMAHPDFIQGLLESDRFKARALEELNDKDLADFRVTLAARVCSAKREVREKVAAANAPAIYAPPGEVPLAPAPNPVVEKKEQPF